MPNIAHRCSGSNFGMLSIERARVLHNRVCTWHSVGLLCLLQGHHDLTSKVHAYVNHLFAANQEAQYYLEQASI